MKKIVEVWREILVCEIQEETFTSTVVLLGRICNVKQVWALVGEKVSSSSEREPGEPQPFAAAETPALTGAAAGALLLPCPEGRTRCAEKAAGT